MALCQGRPPWYDAHGQNFVQPFIIGELLCDWDASDTQPDRDMRWVGFGQDYDLPEDH